MWHRVLSIIIPTFVLSFLVAISGTYEGLQSPEIRTISTIGLCLLFVGWLMVRCQRDWHVTPLDTAFVALAIALAVSILANPDAARRSLIAVWFMMLYAALWYLLTDTLRHRILTRDALIDALLILGVVVHLIALAQLRSVALLPDHAMGDTGIAGIPRPVSIFGNANTFGAFLLVLVPFGLQRALNARNRLSRIMMSLYTLVTLLLLVFSFSRGAWIGTAAALCVMVGLWLAHHNRLSLGYWRTWYAQQARHKQALAAITISAIMIGVVAASGFLLYTLTIGGRTLDLRTDIYNAAIGSFAKSPITGTGIFTFGAQMPLYWSTPPNKIHSHAHNLPLNVAAEMGVIGIVALVIAIIAIYRAMRHNWRISTGREHTITIAAIAATVGYSVHHLLDLPAMLPSIAMVNLLVLVLACTPPKHETRTSRRLPLILLLWSAVLVMSLSALFAYRPYHAALTHAANTRDYATAADQLNTSINLDPNLAILYQQQGMLYALADDPENGALAYQRFTELEPNYAVGWANLAALRHAAGDTQGAIDAMRQAVALAPETGIFALRLTEYGDADARAQALAANPDLALFTADHVDDLTGNAQLASLIAQGDLVAARAYRQTLTFDRDTIQEKALDALLHDIPLAIPPNATPQERAWQKLVDAYLNDNADSLQQARLYATPDHLDMDEPYGANIAYVQYLRAGIPRQFVPQLGWELETDPIFWFLLQEAE